MHNLGLFCLFSISLYKISIEHLRKIEAVNLLIKKLESGKYEKRVYALKIIINFMEISSLDEDLLQEKDYELFDYFLHFTQSELGEEQRLATRGLSKLPLHILKERNPRIMPPPQENTTNMPFTNIEAFTQNLGEDQERQTIKEEFSESSMSRKSSHSFTESDLDRDEESKKSAKSDTKKKNSVEVKEEEKKSEGDLNKIEENKSETSSSETSETSSDQSSSDKSNSPIGSKGNIHSLVSSLSLKIKPRNNADADIQYFSLYSIFNLLLQTNINAADKPTAEEEEKMEAIPLEKKVSLTWPKFIDSFLKF